MYIMYSTIYVQGGTGVVRSLHHNIFVKQSGERGPIDWRDPQLESSTETVGLFLFSRAKRDRTNANTFNNSTFVSVNMLLENKLWR